MCYHLVTYVKYACEHKYRTRRHYIDCNTIDCKLSNFHTLLPHDCMCEEIMLEDQHIIMDVRRAQCDPCLGVGPPPKEYESDSESEESDTNTEAAADRVTGQRRG